MFVLVAQAASMPTAPVISVVAVSSSAISITLVTPSTEPTYGIGSYTLYYGTSATGPFASVPGILTFPFTLSGLIGATQYFIRAAGVDQSANTKASPPSPIVSITTSGGGGKAALRMAVTWIGGNQISAYNSSQFQTFASKCSVGLLTWAPGWDSNGISPHPLRDIMGSIKALATAAGRTPPKLGVYFDPTFMITTLDSKLNTAMLNNFWFLYSTYHSGSLVTSSQGYRFGNYTAGSQVDGGTGLNAQQWLVAYLNDWIINGGVLNLGTAPNVANPNVDFIQFDDGYITLPATGDWGRTGSGASGSAASFRAAYAAMGNALRATNGKMFGFNTGQCGAQLGSPFPEYLGLADIGFMDQMIGTNNTYEYNSSIANFIKDYQLQSTAVKAGNDLVFGHYSVSASNGSDGVTFDSSGNVLTRSPAWQGMRHAIAAMGCLGNGLYSPGLDGSNNAGQAIIWPDAMAVNVSNRQAYTYPNVDAGLGWTGPWVDPAQTAPWQNGVYRRRAQFATVYWNQRGNGSRTVTFDSGTPVQAHYLGVQNPSYDNGNVITGMTFGDRDGAILCNQ
jgi:hypothetical protein